jgi:hypothetical protein
MVMIFQNEKARRQLLICGFVRTFRTKRRKLGKDWATDKRCGKKICDIEVVQELRITSWVELSGYVRASGFDSLSQWLEAIKQLRAKMKNIRGWLYYVRKRTA